MSDAERYGKVPYGPDDDQSQLDDEFPEEVAALRQLGKAPHVLPRTDGVAHETSPGCVCGPTAAAYPEGVVIVHHSLDGREFREDDR